METYYFSFIGTCKGYKINQVENKSVGPMLHEVYLSNGRITIYEYIKGYVFLVSAFDDINLYLLKKNSFDCNPFVPVPTFGEELKKHLSI